MANSLTVLTDAAHLLSDVPGFERLSAGHQGLKLGSESEKLFRV
ncbi:unnamed protein product [Brassica rapa subsp. trilocularis]|uniref:Uncharacterized protein n=1 Tax=Brassica campestris TaxID=3711 RepID=A0A3P5Z4Y8_BRACM|nr:unnamed protein product [Brassica rapa]